MPVVEAVSDFVAISEVAVSAKGAGDLEQAFGDRVRLVERAPGFLAIDVLRDRRRVGRYLMISRWRSREDFLVYMRGDDHRASHDRILPGPDGPKAATFSEFDSIDIQRPTSPPQVRSWPRQRRDWLRWLRGACTRSNPA